MTRISAGDGGRVEVGGQADEVVARISGGSRYEGFDLNGSKVKFRASCGSRAYTLAGDNFDVTVSASVFCRSEPRHFAKHVSKHSTFKRV